MNFKGAIDDSQFFAIHVGGGGASPSNPTGLSKWCIEAVDAGSNSSLVTIWECDGSPQQNFKLSSAYNTSGVAYVGSLSLPDGKCLDGTNAKAGDAPTAQICNGASEQIWGSCRSWTTSSPFWHDHSDNCDPNPTPAPAPALDGQQIQSISSSLCFDLPGGSSDNGALLWMWECKSGDANQQWSFQDGQLVYSPDASKCVDLLGGDATNGNSLGLWDCNGGDSQLWEFDPNMGTIYLASSASDATKCVIGGQNVGGSISIWDCSGEPDQVWIVDTEHSFAVV